MVTICKSLEIYTELRGVLEVINDLGQEQLFWEGELKSLAGQVK